MKFWSKIKGIKLNFSFNTVFDVSINHTLLKSTLLLQLKESMINIFIKYPKLKST